MEEENQLPWIESTQNPWNIRLLDLRPITQVMISSSNDPVFAENALSFAAEDGQVFWGKEPENRNSTLVNLKYCIDRKLEPGVLFSPDCMEHKWAIFYDGLYIIVVRSWLKEVVFRAKTTQESNILTVSKIEGRIGEGDSEAFTATIFNFLILSHCLDAVVPAPLPSGLEEDTENAAYWAFSLYGKMAYVGTFDENLLAQSSAVLRTNSLLHIAAAKSDLAGIEKYITEGIEINCLSGDGLCPLHWSTYPENCDAMKNLINLGADVNAKSLDGTTALMLAVEDKKENHVLMLLKSGAAVNEVDYRGFSALHRAAEMGLAQIVQLLLDYGANKKLYADSHTALSLAIMNKHSEITELLKD